MKILSFIFLQCLLLSLGGCLSGSKDTYSSPTSKFDTIATIPVDNSTASEGSGNGNGYSGGNGNGYSGNSIIRLTEKNAVLSCEAQFNQTNILKSRCTVYALNTEGKAVVPNEIAKDLQWNPPVLSFADAIVNSECVVSKNTLTQECSVETTSQAFEAERIEVTNSLSINQVYFPQKTILIAPKLLLDGKENNIFYTNKNNSTYLEGSEGLILMPNVKVEVEEGDIISEVTARLELWTGDTTSLLKLNSDFPGVTTTPFNASGERVLTIHGPLTAMDLQQVLRTLVYSNSSRNFVSRGLKVYLSVRSTSGLLSSYNIKFLVQAVNDPPVIAPQVQQVSISAASSPSAIAPGISYTDVDSSKSKMVKVTLLNPEAGDTFTTTFVSNSLVQEVSGNTVIMQNPSYDLPVSWFQEALRGLKFSASKAGTREFLIEAEDIRGSNLKSQPTQFSVIVLPKP